MVFFLVLSQRQIWGACLERLNGEIHLDAQPESLECQAQRLRLSAAWGELGRGETLQGSAICFSRMM